MAIVIGRKEKSCQLMELNFPQLRIGITQVGQHIGGKHFHFKIITMEISDTWFEHYLLNYGDFFDTVGLLFMG